MTCNIPICDFKVYEHDAIDMIVFVSPQYKDDNDILDAINIYANAVYNDIDWNIDIVKISSDKNKYDNIDKLIDDIYENNPLKACLMIGEDMSIDHCLIVSSACKQCLLSVQGWTTYKNIYEISSTCDIKTVAWDYIIDIPISLIYPSTSDSYNDKKSDIISVLNKFSINRQKTYNNNVCALFDELALEDIYHYREIFEGELPYIGDTTIIGNPEQNEVNALSERKLKLLIVAGHALSNKIVPEPGIFWKSTLDSINVPLFIPDGCFVNGWFSNVLNDCLYSMPYNDNFFGHSIFDNPDLRVITCSIGQYEKPWESAAGFVGSGGLQRMATGMTIAEAMIGIIDSSSHCLMFGDPTFHY